MCTDIFNFRFTSWNEANAQCQRQGKRLLEPSHDRDYVSFLQNAIDHINNTGLPFPYALMLGAYKNANVRITTKSIALFLFDMGTFLMHVIPFLFAGRSI